MMKKVLLFNALLFCACLWAWAQTWTLQYTNFPGNSTGVDQVVVVDSNVVWVKGFNGSGTGPEIRQFSKTTNGGTTWTYGEFNFTAHVMPANMGASSAMKAFCTAYDTLNQVASFWKTTDGGANWSLVTGVLNGPGTFANVVKFWNSQQGFAMGDPVGGEFDVYYTTNGGDTWVHVAADSCDNPLSGEWGYNGAECGAVADNGVGAFITNKGRVYVTKNYGLSWHVTPNNPFTSCPQSAKICPASADYMIAGNWNGSAWDWKYTNNGGAVWNVLPVTPKFYQYQLCYIPGSVINYVSTSPFYSTGIMGVSHSEDGGLTWDDYYDPLLQPSGSNIQCLGVGFYNRNRGWVGVYDQTGAGISVILRYSNNMLLINPANPDTGWVQNPYTFTFTATGGLPPYTFSVISGNLPSGLSLNSNGILSGTPTQSGTFTFTVQVQDAVSASDQYIYTLIVMNNAGIKSDKLPPQTLLVYPNPVLDNLNIVSATPVQTIKLLNVLGDKVLEKTCNSGNISLSLSGLVPGIYYVVIENAEAIITRKIVKH